MNFVGSPGKKGSWTILDFPSDALEETCVPKPDNLILKIQLPKSFSQAEPSEDVKVSKPKKRKGRKASPMVTSNTPIKVTRSGKVRNSISSTAKKTNKNDEIIKELLESNQSLKTSMQNLQTSMQIKDEEISSLKVQVETLRADTKLFQAETNAGSQKLINFYTDTENTCRNMIGNVSKDWEKRFSKFCTKMDRALHDKIGIQDEVIKQSTCPLTNVIENLQTDIERLDLAIETLINPLDDNESSQRVRNMVFADENQHCANIGLEEGKREVISEFSHSSTNERITTKEHDPPSPLAETHEKVDGKGKQNRRRRQQNQSKRKLHKTIIFMDSNRKLLNLDQLWKNSTMVECGNIPSLMRKITSTDFNDYEMAVVHVGVNDIDHNIGRNVAADLCTAIKSIQEKAPHVKIILSEVTPRQLTRDNEVVECNKHLKSISASFGITLALHSNLRSPDMYRNNTDDKHFHDNKAGVLASNIKKGLRTALGFRLDKSKQYKHSGYTQKSDGIKDFKSQLMNFLKKW